MNKTIVYSVAIVVIGLLVGFYIYIDNTRYSLQSTAKGVAYKIDRRTGKTWLVVGKEERLVKSETEEQEPESDENKAIQLTKKSYAMGDYLNVETRIKDLLKSEKGALKIVGWRARKIDDQTFLISYTFDKGGGDIGYFFEVNLLAEIVRKVSGDPELMKKYGMQ